MTESDQSEETHELSIASPAAAAPVEENMASRRGFAALLGAFGALALTGCSEGSTVGESAPSDELQQALTVPTPVLKMADTAADLRTITGGTIDWIAVLQGITSAADGGGGVFYWSVVAKADDGWSSLNASSANTVGWRRMNPGTTTVRARDDTRLSWLVFTSMPPCPVDSMTSAATER